MIGTYLGMSMQVVQAQSPSVALASYAVAAASGEGLIELAYLCRGLLDCMLASRATFRLYCACVAACRAFLRRLLPFPSSGPFGVLLYFLSPFFICSTSIEVADERAVGAPSPLFHSAGIPASAREGSSLRSDHTITSSAAVLAAAFQRPRNLTTMFESFALRHIPGLMFVFRSLLLRNPILLHYE